MEKQSAPQCQANLATIVDNKKIEPQGVCCFCLSIKPGALAITVLCALGYGILAITTLLLGAYAQGAICAVLALAASAGAFMIYSGNVTGSYIFACVYLAMNVTGLILSIVITSLLECDTTIINDKIVDTSEFCRNYKARSIGSICVSSLLSFYFCYVLFDYATKLRRAIAQAKSEAAFA